MIEENARSDLGRRVNADLQLVRCCALHQQREVKRVDRDATASSRPARLAARGKPLEVRYGVSKPGYRRVAADDRVRSVAAASISAFSGRIGASHGRSARIVGDRHQRRQMGRPIRKAMAPPRSPWSRMEGGRCFEEGIGDNGSLPPQALIASQSSSEPFVAPSVMILASSSARSTISGHGAAKMQTARLLIANGRL